MAIDDADQAENGFDLRTQVEQIAGAMMACGADLLEPLTAVEFKRRCARVGQSPGDRSKVWRAMSLILARMSVRRLD